MPNDTGYIVVLNDGETYTGIMGCQIAAIPHFEEMLETDQVESFLKEEEYDHLYLGEVMDSDTILRWFRIFFPNMEVEQDQDGQVLIYTGIYE